MSASGKKRASPGADEHKNLFDVELSDADGKKLQTAREEVGKVELANEIAAQKRLKPAYEKRRELLKSIPKFWPVALMNCGAFAIHVQHSDDQKALVHLEDLVLIRDEKECRAFKLEFHFSENAYFTDKVLVKDYKFVPPPAAADEKPDESGVTPSMLEFDFTRDCEPQAHKISWKSDAVNLVKLHPRVTDPTDDEDVMEGGSFFNFFECAKDPLDIGLLIANELYVEAIEYFTGESGGDLLSDDDEDDDEEDDDEDAEEIDLEKPEPKKQKRT